MSRQEPLDARDPSIREAKFTRDIGLGNTYRIEYIKNLVSITTGVFVFTVTFMKDLVGKPLAQVVYKPLLISGWSVLAISIIAGVFHLRLRAAYYISWGLDSTGANRGKHRRALNRKRKIAEYTQISSFFVGLALLVTFASLNLLR
jgi:hypothetical protein